MHLHFTLQMFGRGDVWGHVVPPKVALQCQVISESQFPQLSMREYHTPPPRCAEKLGKDQGVTTTQALSRQM